MPVKPARKLRVLMVLVAALGAAAVSVLAQGGAGAPQAPPAGQAAGAADPTGRGRAAGPGGRGATTEPDFSPKPPVLPLTPAEQAKRFWLPPGFKMEPVLADPDIQEPAQIAFDGNGRMFVLELRGYMQDADGGGELDPVGRISRARGQEQRRRLRDAQRLRRQAGLPALRHAVRRQRDPRRRSRTPTRSGSTPTRTTTASPTRRSCSPPASAGWRTSSTRRAASPGRMDNWMYSTINPVRAALDAERRAARADRHRTAAQWGVTQDNYGKMWFQAGASGMPGYFQLPVAYGNFSQSRAVRDRTSTSPGARRCSSPTCRAA